ncbi:MAG: hypothetical protein AAGJ92_12690 [Pseudomonadota bacterium]
MREIAFIEVSEIPIVRALAQYGVTDPLAVAVVGVLVLLFCLLVLRELTQYQAHLAVRRYHLRKFDQVRRDNRLLSQSHHMFSNSDGRVLRQR